jgi:two-component system, NtrC family, sensor kinase
MIDEELLNSLSTKEKEIFKKGLSDLIEQTYVIEEEYKKLNESYSSLQDFIREMIEVQPNALWILDNENEIFLQNSEAKCLQGLLKEIRKEENAYEIEYKNRFYLVKVANHIDKTVVSATDITEEKRKERLASMGQVAAHLSHEIRNPIGSVSLLASTLFKKVDVQSKPLVLEMKKAIWRVERIIKATLLFTKGLQPNISSFFLNDLADECEKATSQYTFTKEIDFIYDLPNVSVNGDFELLTLVLQNFIFNAIDAIEENENSLADKITLTYKENKDFYSIQVFDTGKEVENKNILFEPFKTTKTKGNGLGLALSLQIIEAHNGKINLLENPKGFEINWGKTL